MKVRIEESSWGLCWRERDHCNLQKDGHCGMVETDLPGVSGLDNSISRFILFFAKKSQQTVKLL